ncbi:MAG: hypothetical protein HY350_04005, partial [Candidatus Omnitrophica bacterium]|nr:hypothetical protein [Candidatus Omnitrophota bacterium]
HSLSVTVSPAAANYLEITGSSTQGAGTANQLTITAKDEFGNTATSYTGDKSLTFSGANAEGAFNPTVTDKNGSAVNFGTATTITFSNGVSSAGASMVLYKVETANIAATQGTITTPTTLSVVVTAAPLSYLQITGSSTQTAGTSNALTITAYDTLGNVATSYSGDKALTFSGANNAPAGNVPTVTDKTGAAVNFGTATTITFTNGVATAGGSMVLYKAESVTINVSNGSVNSNSGHGLSVTINAASASQLSFSQQPSNATAGVAISPAVTVQVYDQFQNLRTSDNSTSVTISIGTNPAGGVLSGTLTNAASAGIATFNNLSISVGGNGYTLSASSSGLTSATSNTFNISVVSSTASDATTTAFINSQISTADVLRILLPDAIQLNLYQINTFVPFAPVYLYHPLGPGEIAFFRELEGKGK